MDIGTTIRAVEVASNANGDGIAAESNQSAVVALPPLPANVSSPTISGAATQGQMLSEAHGAWTNNPTGYRYKWEDCDSAGPNCTAIAGASGQTYTLATPDVGHTIRVQEIASNPAGKARRRHRPLAALSRLPPAPPARL